MKPILVVTAAASLAFGSAAWAQPEGHGAMPHDMSAHGAMAQSMGDSLSAGTIKKIDKAAGKVTIAHGPLENLGMPGMTMTFPVAQPSALDALAVGTKVRFRAERVGKAITITRIETAD